VQLLVTEKLATRPQLAGDFSYETPDPNPKTSEDYWPSSRWACRATRA
jgi:hypothetical protein